MGLYEYMLKNYEEKNSIEILIDEVEKALKNELYLVALMSTLTIPDALAKIEYEESNSNNYIKWVNEFVKDIFGRKYGEKSSKSDVINYKNGKPLEKTDNEKYLESPTEICGENCYQLRCALLHNIENEIKADKKTPKNRKYIWIDECVLQFTKEEFTNGIMSGYDTYLKELPSEEIVTVVEKFCYINVRELCHDIIRGAREYIKNKGIEEKLPKIKVNNGGGKMMSSLDPKIEMNNWKLYKKYINNLKRGNVNE